MSSRRFTIKYCEGKEDLDCLFYLFLPGVGGGFLYFLPNCALPAILCCMKNKYSFQRGKNGRTPGAPAKTDPECNTNDDAPWDTAYGHTFDNLPKMPRLCTDTPSAPLTLASGFTWCVCLLLPTADYDGEYEYEERRGIYRAT